MFRALTCPASGGQIVLFCSHPAYCTAVYRERWYQMLR